MLSSMTPTIVLDPRGRLYLLLGSPGGTTIITTVYHIVSNLIDHGMTLAGAVAAPRMFHQARPYSIQLERKDSLPDGVPYARSPNFQGLSCFSCFGPT